MNAVEWSQSATEDLAAFLARPVRMLGRQLAEEFDQLWHDGTGPDATTFLQRYPELADDPSLVAELAYEEYCLRVQHGQIMDVDAFCARFPAVREALQAILRCHHEVDAIARSELEACKPTFPQPGESFGNFDLLRELGRGAFARVFLASERALGGRRVVVKLSPGGGSEAETLGRLEHPSIVPIHSARFDRTSRLTAVCMPYLGTATLRDVVASAFADGRRPSQARVILDAIRAKLPADEPPSDAETPAKILQRGSYLDGVLQLTTQLADALAFVHERGVCHCDLKPSNILLTPSGRPMLLDFNLARDPASRKLLRGGTPRSMAPEQHQAMARDDGNWDAVDARSDLYSFGVVLYELLTGAPPFEPAGMLSAGKQLHQEMLRLQRAGARPVREKNPDVDVAVARLVERCLAFEEKDRPTSARELAAALRRCQSSLRRCRRWMARHSRAALLAGCLVSAVVLPIVVVLGMRPPASVRALEQGLAAERDGRHEEAIVQLDTALAVHPDHGEAFFARGRARYRLAESLPFKERDAQLKLSEEDLEQAAALTGDPRIWACRGYCANRQRAHDYAIVLYQRAIQEGYAPAAVWNNLGYSYLRAPGHDWLDALPAFHQAIEIDALLQAAYYNRALALYQLALRDNKPLSMKALSDIQEAIRIGPITAELFRHAACLCARLARQDSRWVETGIDYLRQAIAHGQNPQQIEADAGLAELQSSPQFQRLLHLPFSPPLANRNSPLVDPFLE
jgi:tetratricopeptide (TPR) repeat protein